MGIDRQSDIVADLQIGPTSLGMVRIYVAGEGIDLPLDFDPDEAEEIAEELRAAATAARQMAQKPEPGQKRGHQAPKGAPAPATPDRKAGKGSGAARPRKPAR